MKAGQKLAFAGKQVALFPLENMRITQGVNGEYSHIGKLALDLSTRGVWDLAYAPFDCKVVGRSTRFNAVSFKSVAPVICADGVERVVVLTLLHDNDISDLVLAKSFAQGDKIYDEGGAGADGSKVYASHIHLEVKDGNGVKLNPVDVFFINDTNIINDLGYAWKKYEPPFKVGDRVKIIGTKYATGQTIPFWVKLRTHTIQRIDKNRVLLKEILSFVFIKDIKKV